MAKERNSRSQQRSNVYLGAVLSVGAQSLPVRVRNLSINGALVEGDGLPVEGQRIQLSRGSLSIAGEIAWQRNNHRGLEFDGPIKVDQWVRPTGHRGQQRVDAAIAAIRGIRPSPNLMAIVAEVPDEETLSSLSEALTVVCERIAAMPKLPMEIGEQLIRLEVIAHSIGRIAEKESN